MEPEQLAGRKKKKTRRGVAHKRSQVRMEDRIYRRLEVEHQAAVRTCSCPPYEPHRPGCGNVDRPLVAVSHSSGSGAAGSASFDPHIGTPGTPQGRAKAHAAATF